MSGNEKMKKEYEEYKKNGGKGPFIKFLAMKIKEARNATD